MSFISRKVMIFDFGGGTLDIVVLAIERGVINIKAVGGDKHLAVMISTIIWLNIV